MIKMKTLPPPPHFHTSPIDWHHSFSMVPPMTVLNFEMQSMKDAGLWFCGKLFHLNWAHIWNGDRIEIKHQELNKKQTIKQKN